MRKHRIGVVHGDGIGPEIVTDALAVLEATANTDGSFSLDFHAEPGGAAQFRDTGANLEPQALERMRSSYDAVFKGPVGLPDVRTTTGTEAGLLGGVLREGLDAFANLRPIRGRPGITTPVTHPWELIDYLIVRENTEGLYASRGRGVATPWAAADTLLVTREGTHRIVKAAFEQARRRGGRPTDGMQMVTCVEKSNVLNTFVLFRDVFDEVASEFPDIVAQHLHTDAAAQALVTDPAAFDVLVTENFTGDMLSDLGGGTVGGLGMCPSANVGERYAYFEPVHGSAPALAGSGAANPVAQILAGAMMLEHLGEHDAARRVDRAVTSACADGEVDLLPDGRARHGREVITAAVLERIGPP